MTKYTLYWIYKKIYKMYKKGNPEGAKNLYQEMMERLDELEQENGKEFVAKLKMDAMNIITEEW